MRKQRTRTKIHKGGKHFTARYDLTLGYPIWWYQLECPPWVASMAHSTGNVPRLLQGWGWISDQSTHFVHFDAGLRPKFDERFSWLDDTSSQRDLVCHKYSTSNYMPGRWRMVVVLPAAEACGRRRARGTSGALCSAPALRRTWLTWLLGWLPNHVDVRGSGQGLLFGSIQL